MKKFRLLRPSPALIVASVALFVALGGGAYAAFKLPKNSVSSKQIKNGAVVNSKIANGAVGAAKLKNGAVTSSKLNTSGLTVPTANFANTAGSATNAVNAALVDGETVSKVFANQPPNTGATTVYSRDGLTIQASCDGSGHNSLTATSTDGNAELNVLSDNSSVSNTFENTGTGTLDLLHGLGEFEGSLEIEYANTAGQTVTLQLGTDYEGAFGSSNNCGVWGTGTASS